MILSPEAALYKAFATTVASHASDLHLTVGQPPINRINGVLNAIPDTQPFTAEVLLSNMDE